MLRRTILPMDNPESRWKPRFVSIQMQKDFTQQCSLKTHALQASSTNAFCFAFHLDGRLSANKLRDHFGGYPGNAAAILLLCPAAAQSFCWQVRNSKLLRPACGTEDCLGGKIAAAHRTLHGRRPPGPRPVTCQK